MSLRSVDIKRSTVGEFILIKAVIPAKAGIQKMGAEATGCPPPQA
jgi:hypothetical protein